ASKNRTLVAEFEINTYTISASANPANGSTVSGGGDYNHGQSVTLKATPAEGYTFVGWKEGNSTVSSTATYTFTANKNRTLVAEFEINTYTISASANPANGGTVSGGGNYNHGQSVTLKATPAEGYTFMGWKEGNSTVNSSATYTFTANKDRTLVAEFEAISVENITLSQTTLVATLGDASVQLTATITPSDALNQNIIWSSDNNGVATVNNGLINFVGVGSATITAEIDGISATCNVTVNAATVDVTGIELTPDNLTLTEGDTYTLSATILPNNATNQAINWSSNMPSVVTINNGVVTAISEGTATITATTAESGYTATCNITVNASPRYTITFATTANGTISTTATEFKAGDEVVLTITPADGYQIVAGSLKAHKTGDASTEVVIFANKFTMPHFDVTVTAEFEELTIPSPTSYTITASANPTEGGYVEGTGTYTEGTTISLKARAYAGYKFLKWTDGITAAERNITVTEDANYTAEFEADATIIIYSVTAVAEPAEGGTISGARNYNANDYATLVAKANEGYRFVHWMSNGQELSTNIEYNFEVTQDSTLIAVFEVSPICLPTTHEFDAIACQVYEWNGQPYTTSGNHVQQFITTAGCDSTVTLHLSIQEPYNGEFTITTSNSYEWNNQTLTSSGDYVQQFTTAAGCDSTITLHLTIIEQSQTGLFDTACEQLSLSPNPTSTGFYIESANSDVRVYSISGQLVLQQSANGKTYVDISRLVAGTYIVRMGNAAAKVIKL
ncbi:MAG: Ig-like domain-containing protein, partial [Bacteroidales bacterium]|nr:Ig-like domain-containing protein [Bacteroidales bacterium]